MKRNDGVKVCPTCRGSCVVDDGEITHSGGAEFLNGPIKCVADCPTCKGTGTAGVRVVDERAAFEADVEPQLRPAGMDHPFFVRSSDGRYASEWMQGRWEGWQARAATSGVNTPDGGQR